MPQRCCAILIASWALWGLPTLCVAGALKHPCAPGSTPCPGEDTPQCTHNEPAYPHDGGGCGHESGCASDPCSESVISREPSSDDEPLSAPEPLLLEPQSGEVATARGQVPRPDHSPPLGVRIPVHASDIPLLI